MTSYCLCGVPVGDRHSVPPRSEIHHSYAFISNQPSSPSSCMHDIDDDMMRSDPEIMALSPVPNDTGASSH
ncbi:hypothetical protein DPX16_13017 [Anabarilius grahami]|uniref:Uncharacterized protein n=1 Tax=Anabarilius grahami TaxID=495550 RepID=A0A3N0XEG8_ANAGA|nr:hypothetical protein DPX16_13017 [Anabarilius grahami]